ncbi:MAG TPA: SGNH/GDSL hydrolase family protein [Solirubrobacteraceae bacterium]|nr:SGNH/GDSL hydrolase family protein [Solirubrobacteraceae bacterium]
MAVEFDPVAVARERFAGVPWSRYVAIGDSVTEGALGDPYPGYPDAGWAQMTADALRAVRPELEFHNLGERYLTTRQIRERQLDRALELRPDLVTIVGGGNDMLTDRFDPEGVEEDLEAMVAAAAGAGATVFTCTMFNIFSAGVMNDELVALLRPRYERLNEGVRAVAARHDVVFLDFARDPRTLDPDLYSADLQHANRRGHALTAELIVASLAEHAARRVGTAG